MVGRWQHSATVRRALGLALIYIGIAVLPAARAQAQTTDAPRGRFSADGERDSSELARLRASLLVKMKASRSSAEKLLALHEQEKARLAEDYNRRRRLFEDGLISRSEVDETERALAASMARVEQEKRWITEMDIAITEASLQDELVRLPAPAGPAHVQNAVMVRYGGIGSWSLADAAKIENFFWRSFGQRLPISAFGQTLTHDRLRFDHGNAMDVALHPDSREGKSLQSFLREAGIPFIAFRNAAPGAATGAHIHIGQPSLRK